MMVVERLTYSGLRCCDIAEYHQVLGPSPSLLGIGDESSSNGRVADNSAIVPVGLKSVGDVLAAGCFSASSIYADRSATAGGLLLLSASCFLPLRRPNQNAAKAAMATAARGPITAPTIQALEPPESS